MSDSATRSAGAGARQLGHDLVVSDVTPEGSHAVSITFTIPAEIAEQFSYRPGQFLTLRVPVGDNAVARSYSLSSAPGIDSHLTVTVKRIDGGAASTWLTQNAVPGMTLRVLPPSGLFCPKVESENLLLLAAGSGVTPIMSILRTALARPSGTVRVLVCHRNETEAIFAAKLTALAAEHPHRVTVTQIYTATEGRPTAARVREFADEGAWDEAFVCGPEAFMTSVRDTLERARPGHVRVEEFTSIDGDPFVLDEVSVDDSAFAATVELDGQTHDVDWPRENTLVEVLLSRSVRVPYSCREGDCGSCMAKLSAGQVEMACTDALEEEDIEDGYILACQAKPVDGPLEVEF